MQSGVGLQRKISFPENEVRSERSVSSRTSGVTGTSVGEQTPEQHRLSSHRAAEDPSLQQRRTIVEGLLDMEPNQAPVIDNVEFDSGPSGPESDGVRDLSMTALQQAPPNSFGSVLEQQQQPPEPFWQQEVPRIPERGFMAPAAARIRVGRARSPAGTYGSFVSPSTDPMTLRVLLPDAATAASSRASPPSDPSSPGAIPGFSSEAQFLETLHEQGPTNTSPFDVLEGGSGAASSTPKRVLRKKVIRKKTGQS